MKRKLILKSVATYYLMAAAFTGASYGLLFLIYGRTRISFLEWVLILLAAFTMGYLPTLIRLFRSNGEG